MLCKNSRKTKDKTSQAKETSRLIFNPPVSSHFRRKAIIATICVLTIVALGAIIQNPVSSKTVAYGSSVESLGASIYQDRACTNRTLSFQWGSLEAGSNRTLTVYVKNECNSAASLFLRTSNWIPATSQNYMSLDWNYSGQVLKVGEVIPLQLTLTVNQNVNGITSFTFDTLITTNEG